MTTIRDLMLNGSKSALSKNASRFNFVYPKLNRRQFIAWGAGLSSFPLLNACSIIGSPGSDRNEPVIECRYDKSQVYLRYGDHQWFMKAKWFGEKCKIKCKIRKNSIGIKVIGGRLAGLPIDVGLSIYIYAPIWGDWLFNLKLDGRELVSGANLYKWLDGSQPIDLFINSSEHSRFEKILSKAGLAFKFDGQLRLFLYPDWRFELESTEKKFDAIQLKSAGTFFWSSKIVGGLVSIEDPVVPSWVRNIINDDGNLIDCDLSMTIRSSSFPRVIQATFEEPEWGESFPFFPCGSVGDQLEIYNPKKLQVQVLSYAISESIGVISIESIEGVGSKARFVRSNEGPWLSDVNLDGWIWYEHIGQNNREALFNAQQNRSVFPLLLHRNVIWIHETPEDTTRPFRIGYCNSECVDSSFEIGLIDRINLAMPDADYASLQIDKQLMIVDMDGQNRPDSEAIISGSKGGTFCLPLDKVNLYVNRAADFVNLRFTFASVFARLDEVSSEIVNYAAEGKEPAYVVHFPPQHLAEQAFLRQEDDKTKGPCADDNESAGKIIHQVKIEEKRKYQKGDALVRFGKDVQQDRDPLYEGNNDLESEIKDRLYSQLKDKKQLAVQTRLAGESRIAFSLNSREIENDIGESFEESGITINLTLACLTNFSGLTPLVSPRALSPGVDLAEQLKVPDPDISDTTKRNKIAELIADSIQAPRDFETSLELVYRLILSPDSKSGWTTITGASHPFSKMRSPMLTILEQEASYSSVRAIWSPDFDKENFLKVGVRKRKHPVHSDEPPWVDKANCKGKAGVDPPNFRMSLDKRDRHELVALTSVYGLPALRRIVPSDQSVKRKKRGLGSVVPPIDEKMRFKGMETDEGYYVPTPLSKSDISLSSYGGFINLEGQWEPPAAKAETNIYPMWPALTVERWHHNTAMGRDTSVEIVYKGFLFPCGHRASLVKVTQRRFDVHPKFGYPIAVLIQRMFITIADPDKAFPALGQQYSGRGWPAKEMFLETTRTPDIVDPFASGAEGKLNGSVKHDPLMKAILNASPDEQFIGDAFWPRLKSGDGIGDGNEVIFQYKFDQDEEVTKSPLLFVDNTAAHSPQDLRYLTEYYNKINDSVIEESRYLTRAVFKGQRRTYAESITPGDTEFETYIWNLKAKGREPLDRKDSDVFVMDAYMEGADQPPFYPFLDTATIRAQSLSGMSGNSTGQIVVKYDSRFLEVGFGDTATESPSTGFTLDQGREGKRNSDTAVNPSQIYLLISGKGPSLNFSTNGSASGGLAKPNLQAFALSRSQGVVGGSNGSPDATASITSSGASEINAIKKAQSGTFDPSEFFSDAKLLGLLSLKDVCKVASFTDAAPKLIEDLAYSIPLEDLKLVADKVIVRLDSGIEAVETQLDKITEKTIGWKQFYPSLAQRIGDLRLPLKKAKSLVDNLDSADPSRLKELHKEFVGILGELMGAAEALSAEIRSIQKNPTPSIVTDSLNTIKEGLAEVGSVLESIGDKWIKKLTVVLKNEVVKELTEKLSEHYDNKASKDERAQIDYASIYLYGQPYGKLIKKRDSNGILKDKPVAQITLFDTLGKPNLNALRDALLYDTVGGPILRIIESVRRLERVKQDGLKVIGATAIDLLRGVSELDELQQSAEKLHNAVSDRCSGLFTPFFNIFTSGIGECIKLVAGIQEHITVLLAIDADNNFQDIKDSDGVIVLSAAEPRKALETLKTKLRNEHRRIAGIILELEDLKEKITNDNICENFKSRTGTELAHVLTRAQNIRRDAIEQAQTMIEGIIEAAKLFKYADEANKLGLQLDVSTKNHLLSSKDFSWKDVLTAQISICKYLSEFALRSTSAADLLNTGGELKDFTDSLEEILDQFVGETTFIATRLKGVRDGYQAKAQKLKDKYISLQTATDVVADSQKFLNSASTFATEYDRRALALLNQGEVVVSGFRKKASKMAVAVIDPVVNIIVEVHKKILSALNAVATVLKGTIGVETESLLELFLADDVLKFIKRIGAQGTNTLVSDIERDRDLFIAIRDETTDNNKLKAANAAYSILWNKNDNTWRRELAIFSLPSQAKTILDTLAKGELGKLIDFSKLERRLKEMALAFLPTRLNLSYDWGTELRPFPASEPIFEMLPREPNLIKSTEVTDQDLSIVVRGGIDLLTKKKEFSVASEIKAFSIHLFPSFDAVTIQFKKAAFKTDENGSDFKVEIGDVIIGDELKYIQELAEALNPDTGPYVRLLFSPPAIEAGFRLNLGSVNLGAISFLNIALEVSCELPLDSREALFRFALSSRRLPFLISVPPYGGGGFFAIKTQATDLVSMSASFEFGGVGDLSYGPLKAQARATTGIYVEKSKARGTTIEGFFVAMGEAHIACFSLSVEFGLSIKQNKGSMVGTAYYSFEFKVSIFKVKYGVSVEKVISGSSENDSSTDRQLFSIIDLEMSDDSSDEYTKKMKRICCRRKIEMEDQLVVSCVNERDDWRQYFDLFG